MTDYALTYDIERQFGVNQEALFLAHSDPELLASWFTPPDVQTLMFDLDFRISGRLRYAFQSRDRPPIWGRLDYIDIQRPNVISFVQSLTNFDGDVISPLLRSPWLLRLRTDINIKAQGDRTNVHMAVSLHEAGKQEQDFFAFYWAQLAVEYDAAMDRLDQTIHAIRYH